jgi:hypothetical protein
MECANTLNPHRILCQNGLRILGERPLNTRRPEPRFTIPTTGKSRAALAAWDDRRVEPATIRVGTRHANAAAAHGLREQRFRLAVVLSYCWRSTLFPSSMKTCAPARKPASVSKPSDGGIAAIMRSASVLVILLAITGCKSMTSGSKEPLAVSVSAANYSQLSGKELYARLNDPDNLSPEAPAVTKSAKPLFYLLLPGEVYPTDVKMDAVYRELEVSLEPRGYYNYVYQMRAGHTPPRIDYLLRVHFGELYWLRPIVRGDKVTWGNDGIVSSRYMTNLRNDDSFDPRTGLSPEEMTGLHRLVASLMAGGGASPSSGGGLQGASTANAYQMSNSALNDFVDEDKAARDTYVIVVEAFKFDDVRSMKKKAPCAWATFIAVPAEYGRKFSDVYRTMLKTASPYFGGTTHGLQDYEVPAGKVLMGTPVEVPESSKDSPQIGQKSP